MAHSKDKLHRVTGNMDDHLGDVVSKTRRNDVFEGSIDVRTKPFKKNRRHNQAEYDSQYNEQMDALRNMSAADWATNRADYLERGRTPDSLRAQQATRDSALVDKIAELREQGMSRSEAREQASKWMDGQAALHELDGIAGGDITASSRVGDKRVNSSLGSQWRSRVGDIDRAVLEFARTNPGVDLRTVNINLMFE